MSEPVLAKWLRNLIYSSALVPLIIFGQYISPFHFGKVIMLRIVVQVMAVLYVLLIWREPSYRPKSHPLTWAFLLFVLAFTLTTLTSISPLQSFWGTLERMGGLFTFWHYFVFYIVTISVLRTRRDWETLLNLMVAVGVVSSIYGILQRYTSWDFILGSGGRSRPFGTIGNAALFAGYQILVASTAATMLFTKRLNPRTPTPNEATRGWLWIIGGFVVMAFLGGVFNGQGLWIIPLGMSSYGFFLVVADAYPKGAWWFYAVSAGFMFLAATMTAVRGSLLAMIIGTITVLLLWSSHSRTRNARVALVGAIGAVLMFLFLAVLLRQTSLVQNSPYLRRVTDFSSSTTTVRTRFWAWHAGFQGWTDSPRSVLVGWGPENFNIPFSKYFNPKFFTGPGSETFFDRAHNMFIEVLVTMGLVGELTYLSLFAVLFRTLARFIRTPGDGRVIGIGFTGMTVAYIIHNAFIFDTSSNLLTFFMLLGFVVFTAHESESVEVAPKQTHHNRLWTTPQVMTGIALSIALLVTVYKLEIKPAQANFATTRGIVYGWQGDWQTSVDYYRKAIAAHTPGRYEFRNRFAQYVLEISSQEDTKKIPNFEEVVLEVIGYLKENIAESPHDYLPMLYTARMYITIGADDSNSPYNDLALRYAQQALEISPTFVRTYYEVGQAYVNKRDLKNAYAAFDKARELNPDVGLTYWYLAVIEFNQSRYTEGIGLVNQAIAHGYDLSETDLLRLINMYIGMGDFQNVVVLYERVVKLAPLNEQYWIQLAAAYARIGKTNEAILAARKVIGLSKDADVQEQARTFIRQLGGTP